MATTNKPTNVDKAESAQRLHLALTRPDRISGIRLPTYPQLVATCTTQLAADGDVNTSDLHDNLSVGLLFRDPQYPLWWGTQGGMGGTYYGSGTMPTCAYTTNYAMADYAVSDIGQHYSGTVERMAGTYSGAFSPATSSNIQLVGPTDFPFAAAYKALGARATGPIAVFPDNSLPDIPYTYFPANSTVTLVMWTSTPLTAGKKIQKATILTEEIVAGDRDQYVQYDIATGMVAGGTVDNAAWITFKPLFNRWVRPKSIAFTTDDVATTTDVAYPVFCSCIVTNTGAPTSVTSPSLGTPDLGPTVTYPATSAIYMDQNLLLPLPFATGATAMGFTNRAVQSIIPTGVRLTMENTTKIMNREGSLMVGMIDNVNTDFVRAGTDAPTAMAAIASLPAERRFRCGAEHGLVATVFPGSNLQDLRTGSVNVATGATPALVSPAMTFRTGDYAALIVFSDPDKSTPTAYTMRCYWTWEYITSTQFVKATVSGSTLGALHEAVRLTMTKPVFSTYEKGMVLAVTGQQPNTKGPKPKPKPKKQPNQGQSGRLPKGWHAPMALPPPKAKRGPKNPKA